VHELAVAEQLLKLVEEEAQRAGARRVVAVHLVLGEHSHIAEEALRFHFERLTSQGSPAEGAQLRVRREPMRFRCLECDADYAPPAGDWRCPRCGEVGKLLDPGDELRVESLEVEMANTAYEEEEEEKEKEGGRGWPGET